MDVHSLHDAGQHQKELDVLMGRHSRLQHIDAGVGGQGPVVVLSGAVDALERLFMEQAGKAAAAGYLFHGLHDDLVVVHCQVGLGVDGRQLMLGRSHLVMLGLGRHPQLPELLVKLLHERAHPLPDHAVVVVVHLLALGRHGSEQGAARIDQVFSL